MGSTREEQGAQETECAQWCELRKGSGTETPGALQSSFQDWGFWKPLCWSGCKHTAPRASFPSTLDPDVPLSRFKEGSAHSQTWQSSSSSPEQLSSRLCAPAAPADHKGELKTHIPKGQEWNLLCWSEIWYLLCSWGWRATSLNSSFQVSPLKLLQILAPCFFKGVWKQFFGRKCPGFFLPQI